MEIQENVPLAPFTTLRVGGPARFFAEALSVDEVREAVAFAKSHDAPLFVLGGGSNLLISDQGWPGLVLKVGILGINHRHGDHRTAYFDVGAGESWEDFVAIAVRHNCSGIECLSGIPGTVGGTPVQNVGAYGQEVSDTINSVVALHIETAREEEFEKEDCGFAYRTSHFNRGAKGRYIILRVSFALTHGGEPRTTYIDLKRHFEDKAQPTLAEVRQAVLEIRDSKAMLIRPGDEDSQSAGSFFKNPVVSALHFDELNKKAHSRGLQIPSFPMAMAQRKVPAAWLVENSGFSKGLANGRVGISRKHALAVVNRGGASAEEIVRFKDEIQQRVQQQWGVRLEMEPVLVGFDRSRVASR
jgi:UDP-N-acetylmuramate dehydrogenase